MSELLDARGVVIEPGDTAIYGFGVSRSVAMAEGVVVEDPKGDPDAQGWGRRVALTPSGRVKVRVVRRSYSSGTKPVVDVAPDRLVVLKPSLRSPSTVILPPSPLPTQGEIARKKAEASRDEYTAGLRATRAPYWWNRPNSSPEAALADYHAYCAKRLAQIRRELKALDEH